MNDFNPVLLIITSCSWYVSINISEENTVSPFSTVRAFGDRHGIADMWVLTYQSKRATLRVPH